MDRRLFRLLIAAALAGGCVSPQRVETPAAKLSALELLAAPKEPNTRYYVILFGSQATPKLPRWSHTWAMAIKATCMPGEAKPALETHTISWMPTSLEVRALRFTTEPGANFSPEFSIEHALNTGQRVSAWGPFETSSGLFTRFVVQQEFLESGAVQYQCIDTIGEAAREGNACDCFHALSDMDPYFDRRRYPIFMYGAAAARNIVRQLQRRPTLIDPETTHDWLFAALGLDRYPIVRREYHGKSVEFSPEAALEYIQREAARKRSSGELK